MFSTISVLIARRLQQTLDEEKEVDLKLTEIAETEINFGAAEEGDAVQRSRERLQEKKMTQRHQVPKPHSTCEAMPGVNCRPDGNCPAVRLLARRYIGMNRDVFIKV